MSRTRSISRSHSNAQASGQRLQKVLAAAGHGSRRACEELIIAGRVAVDGEIVNELGTRVDPDQQEIRVDGQTVSQPRYRYFVLNKPTGVLSTNRDPSGRARAIDLVPDHQRMFTVGRLDKSSEGLMLITNDGELANRLAHPRYGVEKVYQVEVAGHPKPEHLRQLRHGLRLAEAMVRADKVIIKRKRPRSTVLEISLREGRNREIRRMLARLGHKVLRLRRIAMGPLRLGSLPTGAYRDLTTAELKSLRRAGNGQSSSKERPRRKS